MYLAEERKHARRVAVKVLHPRFAKYEDAVKRFLREARAASSINHPNIVDVTDFGVLPNGLVYFVMEYLDGVSLEDVIEREGAVELHRGLNELNMVRGITIEGSKVTVLVASTSRESNTASPPSMTDTTELVVPKSMPIIFAIEYSLHFVHIHRFFFSFHILPPQCKNSINEV